MTADPVILGGGPAITAIAPWFGGKRTLAPVIVQELGPHSSYFEPFCGGMSVLLQKPASSHENVNDLHGDLINLAMVVRDPSLGPKLYRRLRRIWCSEDLHRAAAVMMASGWDWDGTPDLGRAECFFIHSWVGRNGTSGTHNYNTGFCKRWTPNGGHGGKRLQSAVGSIPAWRRRMRVVTITRMDGFEFIGKIADCPSTAIYADPPYLTKGAKYIHDFEAEDHQRLADLLRRFTRARVVVSYYADPRLADLYPGWTVRDCSMSKATSLQNKRGSVPAVAPEVLLLNGPSYASPTALFGETQ